MMRALFASCALVLAAPAHAEDILGKWLCQDAAKGARAELHYDFKADGKLHADLRLWFFDEGGATIGEAQFDYIAIYRQDGNKLFEKPIWADIVSYRAFGVDISNGIEARQTQSRLLIEHDEPSKLRMENSDKMEIRAPGNPRVVSCDRVDG